MSESLRIVRLYAENFKKLKVVDIRPTSDMVRITGANGEGKSSVLDAIWATLGGKGASPTKPIRDGMNEANIEIDLGKYVVSRRFTQSVKQPPIVVKSKDGKSFKSPQDLLDQMMGELTFDPLAFARMKPDDQAEEIRRISKLGSAIDELDALNQVDYMARAEWNRKVKESKTLAEAIVVPEDLPSERINVVEMVEKLDQAAKHNSTIQTRKSGRAMHLNRIQMLQNTAKNTLDALPQEILRINGRRDARLLELQKEMEAVKVQAYEDVQRTVANANHSADVQREEAARIQESLDKAEPIPEPMDVITFKEQIGNAQLINAAIDQRLKRDDLLKSVEIAEKASRELTLTMANRELKKREIIASAKMPVPGLGFENSFLTYKGLPFEQASSAEQLRVSVGVAMAANPTLRILRITDGSLLDSKSMAIVADMAKEQGFQIWVECVSDDKDAVGIVMEDGAVAADNQA